MIRHPFKKKAAKAVQPPASPDDAPPARYKWMSLEEAQKTLLKAVLDSDMGVAESIAYYHPDCHNWIIPMGGSIGGERMVAPLVHYPAASGNHTMLQWLIKRGANLEAYDNVFSCTALYRAAFNGDRATVEILLAAGADPAAQTRGHTPVTAAQEARARGHADVADLIEGKDAAHAMPKTLRVKRMHFREG